MKIYFCGGALSVTGANYLLDFSSLRVLVDCGLFQGFRFAEHLNYADFAYDPKSIDFLIITHSHADHIGRLPKLVRDGFRGRILTVEPTKEIMHRALPHNWEHIAEEAKADNHDPLYQPEDIKATMEKTEGISYHQPIKLSEKVSMAFWEAGHILGSAIVGFTYKENGEERKLYFTGDLGNSPSLILRNKEFVHDADYLVAESAYGDRVHESLEERSRIFREIVERVISQKGTLLIPTFAIERAQEIVFEINKLFKGKKVEPIPVFLDSPLAIEITEAFVKYSDYFNQETRHFDSPGDSVFDFPELRQTKSVAESKAINDTPSPKIIIAGSGMSAGGRILHHEKRYLPDSNSTIIFVGYQVEGSLGRQILDGQPEVTILGNHIPVRCQVKGLGGYSAHADQPALLEWIKTANDKGKVKKVFIVQGEEKSAKALAQAVSQMGLAAVTPVPGEEFELK